MHFRTLIVVALLAHVTALGAAQRPLRAAEPAAPSAAAGPAVPHDGPLSPAEALSSFVLETGLRIEPVAAEPLVDSPVAIAFDERGRMFVAENRGYPNGPGEGKPPVGRIAMLEDRDGDGRFEQRSEFADGLTFPNGLMPWRGGLIVTCAPDILYLQDTDDDGHADQRAVWFTGFSTKGSTQLRVSHPTLGVDNWIYVTSGLSGGEVTCPLHPERPAVTFGRAEFRFRPDLSEYEACDGGGQYGLCFDDFGRRFICYNRVQVQHVVLSSRYLRRNPHLAFSDTVQNCPVDLAPEPLKGHGQGARLFPISANVTTADSHAGTFTAACGVLVWRGASLPDRYRDGAFSCDPTGNLVHFDTLEPHGATFTAQPGAAGREFLASTDNWFRPVFLALGPDEALYICDMYRKTIEHPDYLPVEIRKRTDFTSGQGMGRIWRVVGSALSAQDLAARRSAASRAASSDADLEILLRSPGGYAQQLAQRLLLENPRRMSAQLGRLLDESQIEKLPPAAIATVLRILEARGQIDDMLLIRCLRHAVAGVREQALVVAEPRLAASPALVEALLPLADDPDPRVRFQWALCAGAMRDARLLAPLARLATRDAADRWLRAAVFSSLAGREDRFLGELLSIASEPGVGPSALYLEFGRLLGASQPATAWPGLVSRIIASGDDLSRRGALLAGLGDAVRRQGTNRTGQTVLAEILSADTAEMAAARKGLAALIDQARIVALSETADIPARETAVALLAQTDFAMAGATLVSLVDPRQPAAVQAAAVRALAGMRDETIATTLLSAERFSAYTPALQEEVLSAMFAHRDHLPGVLAAVEANTIPPGAIDSLRRKQLTEHQDVALRERARKIFGVGQSADRAAVYEDYKPVLALAANAQGGRAVFKKHCANCHRLDREGFAVGPDLFGIRNQPKEAILLHLLIPEYEITPGFAAYVLETTDGRTLTGLIASDTAASVTLRQALGKEETVLRSEIERLTSSRISLMPQELEKTLSRQDIADVIAYLKGEGAGEVPAAPR